MKVLLPDTHLNCTIRLSIALNALGIKIVIPSRDYVPTFHGVTRKWVWADNWTPEFAEKVLPFKNWEVLNKSEILDSKIDACIIPAYESQFEVMQELIPKMPKATKTIFWSGNAYYSPICFPYFLIKNYFYGDYQAGQYCKQYNIPNSLHYIPYVEYDQYKYTGDSSSLNINSYICNFEQDWPDCYKYSQELARQNPEVKHNFHSTLSRAEVISEMQSSIATLHVKSQEGLGMAIIESLACGRPVLLPRQLMKERSFTQWCIENVTALYFSNPQEYRAKVKALIESSDYRNYLQASTAANIRQLISNEQQCENLQKFLENLQ